MNNFKELLNECGLSKKGAAQLLKVRYDTIKNWYYGRAKIPDNVIIDLKKLKKAIDLIF